VRFALLPASPCSCSPATPSCRRATSFLVLYDHKRDLADALLEGSGSSSTLSVDELVDLVRETSDGLPRSRAVSQLRA
jgi:hypothetical protein